MVFGVPARICLGMYVMFVIFKRKYKYWNSSIFLKSSQFIFYQSSILSITLCPLEFNPLRTNDDLGFCKGANPRKLFENGGSEFSFVIIEI